MAKHGYTKHGQKRANQRGFRSKDIDLIRRYGSIVEDSDAETWMLTNKDIEDQTSRLKREIQELERLRRCKAVFGDNELVTVYRTNRTCEKSTIRRLV